ncbi:MAG TPA: AAA family ATPase [Bryobacteraceae bacterium]|nr:AAA family ATPase [Bryobacteraceae bacterium]
MERTHIRLNPARMGIGGELLQEQLRSLIVGQDEAIRSIVDVYQTHLTGLSVPGRPIGSLLFLGPTGSGKTRIVEATAECLLGNSRAILKIDCGEFQHSHEIAKLIGSPPGYMGHRDTRALLSQEALDQYFTPTSQIAFVLFDEIEKASDALWNLLLGILDKATLTLGDNRKVDFSQAMIFLTSNLGASEMAALLNPRIGFAAQLGPDALAGGLDKKISRTAEAAARRKFTPEFINRLDKIVSFKPLGEKQLRQILDIELRMVQERIFTAGPRRSFVFNATGRVKEMLLREGTDVKYGARHLKRAIERLLVQPISNLMATAQARPGDSIRIDLEPSSSRLTFVRDAEGLPFRALTHMAGRGIPAAAAAVASSAAPEQVRTWKSTFFK